MLGEKVTWVKMVTLLIAIAGISVINPFSMNSNLLGNVLVGIVAILFALLVTEMRKEDKDHGIGDVAWFMFFASLFLLPFPLVYGFGNITEVWIPLLLLGFVSTGLAYLLFNLGLQNVEAETASIINIIVTPLVAIPLAFFFVNEEITPRVILGGAILISAGIYLQLENRRIRKKRERQKEIAKQ
jgi:drug/metabolite transporter (DMT)-like permease